MPRKRPPTDPTKAVAYLRLSTDVDTQATSFAVQRSRIEAWAARLGVEVVAWHEDQVSGTKSLDKRPALGAALESLRTSRASYLVVQRFDRFARDTTEAAHVLALMDRMGAHLATAEGGLPDPTPAGKFLQHMMLGVAELEGAMIRVRVQGAMDLRRARGQYLGGQPPYGYRREGKDDLVPEPSEQALVALFRSWHDRRRSFVWMERRAAQLGLTNRRGHRWRANVIHRLVTRAEVSPSVG